MDPYQVLGIRPDADTGQIRTAYRRRARHVHPDAGGDDDAFTRLQDAYRRALHLRSAVLVALLAGVGAGYAVYVVTEVDRWLSWRARTGRATPRTRWWRASGPPRR